MKKTIIVLSAIAFIAGGGCGQKADKQAATKATGADSSANSADAEALNAEKERADRKARFDSTLVGHEDGYVTKDTVTASDWKNVNCKWQSLDDGYTTRQECVFPGAKLQQVYDIIKKADPNLKIGLPAANLEYSCRPTGSGCNGVSYQYKSPKQLRIDLSYDGGATSIEITEGADNTLAKITYSAD
ncbi:hypothetical protein R80B4_00328 [Fibrobacteres bacterium R8-0-B4]